MSIPVQPLSDADIRTQKQNEENTKLNKITPIIKERWNSLSDEKCIMEYYFTAGRISIDEYNDAHRGAPKKVDYLLLYYNNVPIALVEAKGEAHNASEGYQQAKDYARLLDVPFAYATNGDDLIEADMISGTNRNLKITDFPYPEELWKRFMRENNFSDEVEESFKEPYYTDTSGRAPRYYQRIAINRIAQAIAEGKKRILLVMATGTGKTYTAFQFLYRQWSQKKNIKILYLADRNILIDQTLRKDFKPFGSTAVKIDNKDMNTSYQIYLGLYQQLTHENKDYYKEFPCDYFDIVVVDECHRGSSSEDSHWRQILNYYSDAVQIGMTATPRDGGLDDAQANVNEAIDVYNRTQLNGTPEQIRKAKENVGAAYAKLDKIMSESTITYFGEPIFTYSLKQGIKDGFLAPYKVIAVTLDIDKTGYFASEGTIDKNGEPVVSRLYTQVDFDRSIVIEDRRQAVAERITEFLKTNDARYEKTIVFCEDIEHARDMVQRLENLNADLVAEDSRYIMQITGDNEIGKAQLDNFQEPSSRYPVIAVTSRLLSTGVDVETCKNIVLDRTIGSMTEFKQIIGRGTRVKEKYEIDEEEYSKMYFNILDFRSNYLKFNDPDFDGEPVVVIDVPEHGEFPKPPIKPTQPTPPKPGGPSISKIAHINGIEVEVLDEMVRYLDSNGNLVQTNINNCIKNNVLMQYPTSSEFNKAWLGNKDKRAFAYSLLLETDISEWESNYKKRYGYSVDIYDILKEVVYDFTPPVSKERRTENISIFYFINSLSDEKKELTALLLNIYINSDFERLKDLDIFNLPQFAELGYTKLSAVKAFGGKPQYYAFLTDLENKLYEGE